MAYLVKAEAPNELTAQSTERQTRREKKKRIINQLLDQRLLLIS